MHMVEPLGLRQIITTAIDRRKACIRARFHRMMVPYFLTDTTVKSDSLAHASLLVQLTLFIHH
jgi:hypothetical protein